MVDSTQSAAPPNLSDDEKPQNAVPEVVKVVDGDGQEIKGDATNESPLRSLLAKSEPMREEQVQNAVKFLLHPKVRGSPVIYRRSFLERKGLTKEEIDEAFRRVPDPPSNVTTIDTVTSNQATQPKSLGFLQPQVPSQTSQPGSVPINSISSVVSLQQPRFRWSLAFLAVGILAASGAGTAVFFKNVVVPRLKAWIRKVVAGENDLKLNDKPKISLEKVAAEAARAAASAAAVVAKASQELLSTKNEERKYFDAFMGMLNVQVEEMKSMGKAIHNLESAREAISSEDKQTKERVQLKSWNGTSNNPWKTPQPISGSNLSHMDMKHLKVNGSQSSNLWRERPSSTPASVEVTTVPSHPKSYMEIMEMIQRGERPPNIQDVDDMPPNPDQPISKPLLAPRLKPWEMNQQAYQRRTNGLQSQATGGRLISEVRETNQLNGGSSNGIDPWWRKRTVKITELEPEAEASKQTFYGIGANEQLINQGWVPSPPPKILVPEAAAAIRQPKSSFLKQQSGDEMLSVISTDGADHAAGASDSVTEPERFGSIVVNASPFEVQDQEVGLVPS